MTVQQRQTNLIKKIASLTNEDALTMLEQELSFLTKIDGKDIVDSLNQYQVSELTSMVNEPSAIETVNEAGFKKATQKWRSK